MERNQLHIRPDWTRIASDPALFKKETWREKDDDKAELREWTANHLREVTQRFPWNTEDDPVRYCVCVMRVNLSG